MLVFKTKSPFETCLFGKRMAEVLSERDIICLSGDLGAGKTLFVQGIAQGFHVSEEVTSPTFNVLNIYNGHLTMYHFDLYRLDTPEELEDIGFYEYTSSGGVVLIEWPDNFIDFMPEDYLWVKIEKVEEENDRLIYIKAVGERYDKLAEELKVIGDTWYRHDNPCF